MFCGEGLRIKNYKIISLVNITWMKVCWIYLTPDSQHPSFFESSDERGIEGRTVVTNEYHLQQTETDGQQEVQDTIGIAVADQD